MRHTPAHIRPLQTPGAVQGAQRASNIARGASSFARRQPAPSRKGRRSHSPLHCHAASKRPHVARLASWQAGPAGGGRPRRPAEAAGGRARGGRQGRAQAVRRDGDGEDARTPLKPFRSRPRAGRWMCVPAFRAFLAGRCARAASRRRARRSASAPPLCCVAVSAAAARGCGGRAAPAWRRGVAVLSVLRVRVACSRGRWQVELQSEAQAKADGKAILAAQAPAASHRIASHRIASHRMRERGASASGTRPLA